MNFLKRIADWIVRRRSPVLRFRFVLMDEPSEEEQIEMVKTYVPEAEYYSLYDAYTIALIREFEAVMQFKFSVEGY